MKKFLFAVLATLSINCFSQSYLIMENGIIVTTDKDGFAYDIGQFTYPDQVTLKGGQYYVENNNVMVTIDERGGLFRKYEIIPEIVLGKGINYFISSLGELYTVDKQGVVNIISDQNFLRAASFGGNYFTVALDNEKKLMDIYSVTHDGKSVKVETELKQKDVVAYGGNYFMTTRGVLYTISGDGLVSPKPEYRVGILLKKGGNYFTDSAGILYTVADDGTLKMPGLPMSLRVGAISKLGSNYFLDISGRLFIVDRFGNIFERTMRDQDLRNAKIISL